MNQFLKSMEIARIRAGFSALASVFALFLCISTIYGYVNPPDPKKWTHASALVVLSEVEKGCDKNQHFSPHVQYRYDIDGASHDAKVINLFRQFCGLESDAAAIAARYPVGTRISVLVNPAAVDEATIETDPDPSSDGNAKMVIVLTGLVSIVAAFGAWLLFRDAAARGIGGN